ncbi:hypothetical protein LEP1GSC024_0203 [Leptospira noguchii str. 2001034031]|uniref:Uncharacterized protein n=1 Tax=Leptospira noguchii str. 2001034031 TaxID=1193053 RepID=M6YNQ4_9LEPT|nr:hypothetical protein LEP1GSC024_0203 [Leptospira noguchii str. 2001034031]
MKTILTIFISFLLLGENLYANRGRVTENPIDVLERSPENKAISAQRLELTTLTIVALIEETHPIRLIQLQINFV